MDVRFINMILLNTDDVRTMFAIFDEDSFKGMIELDAILVRSIHAIQKSLIHQKVFEENVVCMVEYDQDAILVTSIHAIRKSLMHEKVF